MAANERFDESVSKWLEESAPARLPERVLNATFERTRNGRQRVGWRALLGRLSMPKFLSALGSAALIVVVAALALNYVIDQQGGVGALSSASPSAGATVSASPSVEPTASVPPTNARPSVFTEIAPGEFVEIPDWPLGERTTPPMVWTGAELIVWGEGIYQTARDGAAFDLANGTWRVIAEAPLSPRGEAAAAWTGTEMIVWGGRVDNSFYYDGAAYNPATDTWRLLPGAPAFFGKDPSMIWIGNEAVVFGVTGNADTTGEYVAAAAYDPVANSWRALADAPASVRVVKGNVWWTGESIIAAGVGYGPESDRMARYDLAADRWTMVDVGSSAAVVGVPDSDGRVSTFVSLPYEKGAPVQLIEGTGSLLAELPAFPGDPNVFGDQIQASGLWVGDEAVFEIWTDEPDYGSEQIWALNPSTQTWRRLDADTAFPRIDSSAVVVGDLLLMSNRPTDVYRGTPRACCVAPPSNGGSIYRINSSPIEVTP
jgi:hypothetical protein